MNILLILVMGCYLNLFQIVDSKQYRIEMKDKILPYIDRSITPLSNYFSLDNLILEQVDDDNVQIGGYIKALKPMDRNLPLVVNVRTKFYEKAVWNEAAYRLTLPSTCLELINPQRFWYNITKLWSSEVCPTQTGDNWVIESQQVDLRYNVPAEVPIVPWRIYILLSQGIPGFEKFKIGYGIEIQFVPIK